MKLWAKDHKSFIFVTPKRGTTVEGVRRGRPIIGPHSILNISLSSDPVHETHYSCRNRDSANLMRSKTRRTATCRTETKRRRNQGNQYS